MKITYDPAKRLDTLDIRELDFDDAGRVFSGKVFTAQDSRRHYGEARFQSVGHLDGRMVMIVWTPRGNARHIISMRKCNAKEQARYADKFEGP